MSVLRVDPKRAPSGIRATVLDPPTPLQVTRLRWTETSEAGVFELSETGPEDAVFEEGEGGVFTLTDSPSSGAQARLALIQGVAIMYG